MGKFQRFHIWVVLLTCATSALAENLAAEKLFTPDTKVIATGKIVDQKQQSITDVTVNVEWYYPALHPSPSPRQEQFNVSGKYRIESVGAKQARVRFSKPGLPAKEEVYDFEPSALEPVTSATPKRREIGRDVVMRARNTSYSSGYMLRGVLGHLDSGNHMVFHVGNLSDFELRRKVLITSGSTVMQRPYSIRLESLGYPVVLLDVLADPGRDVLARAARGVPGEYVPLTIPEAVGALRFVGAGAGDGFHPVVHASVDQGSRGSGLSDLTEAPADGYSTTILLPDRLFLRPPEESLYFYLRSQGYYAKGRITDVIYNPKGDRLTATVELFINRNGSRDLVSPGM